MAIDTENKRRSVLNMLQTATYPVADGTIATLDRQHVGKVYRGIATRTLTLGPYYSLAHGSYMAGGRASGNYLPSGAVTAAFRPGAAASDDYQSGGSASENYLAGGVAKEAT